MDTAMRDLERLEEHEGDSERRRVGTTLTAALVTAGLILAMGKILGEGGAQAEGEPDPLAALDRAAALNLSPEEDSEEEASPPVKASDLSFPDTLADYDSRPEVEAALAAAAAELAYPDPIPAVQRALPGTEAEPSVTPLAELVPVDDSLPNTLPAGVAAGPASEGLSRSIPHDPMVRDSIPSEPAGPAAPAGREGLYTLQVISYQRPDDARIFADGLRARGHGAFVVSANVPDRGMHWRVRIGPFATAAEAQSYRQAFEAEERMNTFVVRRRDDNS